MDGRDAGVEVVALAVPADRVGGASGDWHDLLPLPGRRMAIVVGDAAGRGLAALPLRCSIQPAARRLAMAGMPPDGIIAGLRDAVPLEGNDLATVVVVALAADGSSFTVSSAGHPPPLLLRPDGSAEFIAGAASPPLGAPWRGDQPVASAVLPEGGTLVVYTDGLVDRRDQRLGDGFTQLARSGIAVADKPLLEVCARVIRLGLVNDEPADDLTAVAVRPTSVSG
jgi:serine phosphatase RsbU (regulator of sigma subunit)